MIENVSSSGKRLIKEDEVDPKTGKRQSSNTSRNSSSGKFLKRKPDPKKVFMGSSSKKKKQATATEYFDREMLSDSPIESQSVSEFVLNSDKYINERFDAKGSLKLVNDKPIKMLESAKSQSNLFLRRKQLELPAASKLMEAIKNNKQLQSQKDGRESQRASNKGDFDYIPIDANDDYSNNYGLHNHRNSKKSRTQFFNYQNFSGLNIKNEVSKLDDAYELVSTRENGELSKDYRKIKQQCTSLTKKNKYLTQQMELYMQRQYLLQTEKRHLSEIIKQKDKIIDRLQRQKEILGIRSKTEITKEMDKSKEQIEHLKSQLVRQEQRLNNLKEQNEFIRNQLIIKNEELLLVYDKYNQLQNLYHEEQKQMIDKFQKMKQQAQRPKQQYKQEVFQYTDSGQIQKWKQRLIKQQQQLKYLKIQNQCLLIAKDQLKKTDIQNRKLRQERDYFKRKVLQNVKRTKKQMKQISFSSDNSSLLFQLSEISIQKS